MCSRETTENSALELIRVVVGAGLLQTNNCTEFGLDSVLSRSHWYPLSDSALRSAQTDYSAMIQFLLPPLEFSTHQVLPAVFLAPAKQSLDLNNGYTSLLLNDVIN